MAKKQRQQLAPLHVVAHVAESVVLRSPLMLDAMLAWAVAAERNLLPPLAGQEPEPIEIPIEREPGGRFHLCSEGFAQVVDYEQRYKNRRAPVMQYARLGHGRIKRVDIAAGPNKGYRVPYELRLLAGGKIEWWCLGEPDEISRLLGFVRYVGKHRGSGKGRLDIHGTPWTVEHCQPWPGFPVITVDGKPLRPLPLEWPGLSRPRKGFRCLTYPSWDHSNENLCAIPG